MALLCIDIGNTHTHFGVVDSDGTAELGSVPTATLDDCLIGLPPILRELSRMQNLDGVAFCSVVPAVNERLRAVLALHLQVSIFQLTHECQLGVSITYPHPVEIGQDRLANAVAAHALGGSPALVIDSGTAVTFDVITQHGGYEGGIIAPGLEVTRRYLHERTAQLPLLDDSLEISGMIGKSTAEAMRIGTVVGFSGLIQALLDGVLAELAGRGERVPHLFITGGNAAFLEARLRQSVRVVPDLTLRGLAIAYGLNRR